MLKLEKLLLVVQSDEDRDDDPHQEKKQDRTASPLCVNRCNGLEWSDAQCNKLFMAAMKQMKPYCNEIKMKYYLLKMKMIFSLASDVFCLEENILYIVIYAMVLLQLEVDFLRNALIG